MIVLIKQNYYKNKELYNIIESNLRLKLDDSIPIHHVGSTSIPTIQYGKNIIDILIGAKDKEQFEQIKGVLENEGYVPSQKSKDEIYQFFSSIAEETRFW
ncbi:MAG: GrpB family protein [Bacilli bacterium]|nr:GrpB family protein [Bacilli bacterium]